MQELRRLLDDSRQRIAVLEAKAQAEQSDFRRILAELDQLKTALKDSHRICSIRGDQMSEQLSNRIAALA